MGVPLLRVNVMVPLANAEPVAAVFVNAIAVNHSIVLPCIPVAICGKYNTDCPQAAPAPMRMNSNIENSFFIQSSSLEN
jgi:hypothetical protein